MDFQNYLKGVALEINQQIDYFFVSWSEKVKSISPKLLPLVQIFAEGCQGGKRLRGVLVKLGYEIAAGSVNPRNDEIMKPAIACEILQTALLAHDDIIDLSPLRRGKPTIYKALGGDHYAISQTICLGNIGFFLAASLISDSQFNQDRRNKAISFFNQMLINTGLGEMLDIELPRLKGNRVDKDVITIHRLKTSYYTIIDPLQLGAILAGADEGLLNKLEVFGENLGIAFQIQDDILGVFGDEQTLGKSVTSDIEEGKNTLLITQALKKATPAQRKILDQYYGHGDVGNEGLEAVRKVFIDTGALDYSRQHAVEYVARAKKIIPRLTGDPKMRKLLGEMADFLVERSK